MNASVALYTLLASSICLSPLDVRAILPQSPLPAAEGANSSEGALLSHVSANSAWDPEFAWQQAQQWARNGVTPQETFDLISWLGPQAWKLDPRVEIFLVEAFAGQGSLRTVCESKGLVAIVLGEQHGQHVGDAHGERLFRNLLLLTQPDEAMAAWPCRYFSVWQNVNMAKDPELKATILANRHKALKLVNMFFVAWSIQTSAGRGCTGENPPDQ